MNGSFDDDARTLAGLGFTRVSAIAALTAGNLGLLVRVDDTLDPGIEVPDEPNPGPEPVPDEPPEPVDPQREPVKTDAIPQEAI